MRSLIQVLRTSQPSRAPGRSGRPAIATVGVLIVVGWAVLAIGCAGRSGGSRNLRVGVAPYYPPIIFESEGQVTGLEADFAARVGTQFDRRIEFVHMTRRELIPAVESGKVDVAMSGISITPERARRVLFTTPYLRVGQLSLIRIEDLGELSRKNSIKRAGVRIGYVDGTTGEEYISTTLPKAESYAFETVEEGVRSLRARRIDIFIHDAPTVWRIGAGIDERELMGLYTPLTEEALAWAVPRKDPELKQLLDDLLDVWRASGQLDQMLNRWIPVRVEVGG